MEKWSGITAIAAGGSHTLGLRSNGVAVYAGPDLYCSLTVAGWRDLVGIAATDTLSFGLHRDGRVSCTDPDTAAHWWHLRAVDGNAALTVGLRRNGTIVASGSSKGNILTWTNIVSIAAGYNHVVGLKADGTLVHHGSCFRPDAISSWTGITAIAAGGSITTGLKKDGTLVSTSAKIELAFKPTD